MLSGNCSTILSVATDAVALATAGRKKEPDRAHDLMVLWMAGNGLLSSPLVANLLNEGGLDESK